MSKAGRGEGMYRAVVDRNRISILDKPYEARLVGIYKGPDGGFTFVFEFFDGVRSAMVESLGVTVSLPLARSDQRERYLA